MSTAVDSATPVTPRRGRGRPPGSRNKPRPLTRTLSPGAPPNGRLSPAHARRGCTVRQAADALGLTTGTVRRLIAAKKLAARKLGDGIWLLNREQVESLIPMYDGREDLA
jgi:excisionase family DNA binding protein